MLIEQKIGLPWKRPTLSEVSFPMTGGQAVSSLTLAGRSNHEPDALIP